MDKFLIELTGLMIIWATFAAIALLIVGVF